MHRRVAVAAVPCTLAQTHGTRIPTRRRSAIVQKRNNARPATFGRCKRCVHGGTLREQCRYRIIYWLVLSAVAPLVLAYENASAATLTTLTTRRTQDAQIHTHRLRTLSLRLAGSDRLRWCGRAQDYAHNISGRRWPLHCTISVLVYTHINYERRRDDRG